MFNFLSFCDLKIVYNKFWFDNDMVANTSENFEKNFMKMFHQFFEKGGPPISRILPINSSSIPIRTYYSTTFSPFYTFLPLNPSNLPYSYSSFTMRTYYSASIRWRLVDLNSRSYAYYSSVIPTFHRGPIKLTNLRAI